MGSDYIILFISILGLGLTYLNIHQLCAEWMCLFLPDFSKVDSIELILILLIIY